MCGRVSAGSKSPREKGGRRKKKKGSRNDLSDRDDDGSDRGGEGGEGRKERRGIKKRGKEAESGGGTISNDKSKLSKTGGKAVVGLFPFFFSSLSRKGRDIRGSDL